MQSHVKPLHQKVSDTAEKLSNVAERLSGMEKKLKVSRNWGENVFELCSRKISFKSVKVRFERIF